MVSVTFAIPVAELPLLEKSLPLCPTIKLLGVSRFVNHCDVFLTHENSADLYQLGCYVGRELELLGLPAGEEVANGA
jgi:hypothetical protein